MSQDVTSRLVTSCDVLAYDNPVIYVFHVQQRRDPDLVA